MRVSRQRLPQLDIVRLAVIETDGTSLREGEIVGYLCERCNQLDETLDQIYHQDDCEYAGRHGRQHYHTMHAPAGEPGDTPELQPEHQIVIIRNGEHNKHTGTHQGEPVGFYCPRCGNADEDLFQVRHDEDCPLAGRYTESRVPEPQRDTLQLQRGD